MSPPRARRLSVPPEPAPRTTWETPAGDVVTIFAGRPAPGSPHRFYWHVQAPNGKVIASSGQGFHRRRSAIRAARRTFPEATP